MDYTIYVLGGYKEVFPGSSSMLAQLADLISIILTVYMWLIIIRVLMSWVNPNPYNPVVQFLSRLTDPVLYYFRRLVPLNYGGVDFSPIILILLLVFANDFIVMSLKAIAAGQPNSALVSYFLIALIRLIRSILFAFMVIVIIRAVLSWISPDPYNPIVRVVYGITEPVMYRLRHILPLQFGGLDLTPIVLIAAIYFVNSLLDRLLISVVRPIMM